MKPGARVAGVAESYAPGAEQSTLAGAVVRASRVIDGLSYSSCTVGGTDATDAVVEVYDRLDREDVRHLLVAGIAPAWYNVLDLREIHDRTGRPTISVTFEESEGLADALREAFDGAALDRRLDTYRRQPDRDPLTVNGETVYVRAVGIDDDRAGEVVRAVTPEGGRPEPVRVARLAARAADGFRRR